MESRGDYFNGQSSTRIRVNLQLVGNRLLIQGESLNLNLPLGDVRLSEPLGQMARSIYLADGAMCEVRNSAFAAALQKKQGKGGFSRHLHRWENSLKRAATALLLTTIVVWLFIRFGIPVLAKQAALAIPVEAEISMGEDAFALLDRAFFRESNIPEARQVELSNLFHRLVSAMQEDARHYQLKFRDSEALGANALALPGGTVVVTDGLLELADNDAEIQAVLAHEVGHIRQRHALRQLIQDSTASLLIATLTGDILSTSSLAAALPTMLIDAKFSRDMEREADDIAAAYLLAQGIPLEHFANILQGLQTVSGGDEQARALDYLSSHPATAERIERLRTQKSF